MSNPRDDELAKADQPHELAKSDSDRLNQIALAMADAMGPAIAQSVALGISQAVGSKIIPTNEDIKRLERERDVLLRQLQSAAQHATNVLVAFRICAAGRRAFNGDDFADDQETAGSISALMELAEEMKCEGVKLFAQPKNVGKLTGGEYNGGIFGQ